MKKVISVMIGVSAVLLLGGCAHTISPYSPSFANINTLHKMSNKSRAIKLGKLTDPKQTREISCRLEGNENLPGNVTYVEYLKNALKKDLTHAGLYSDNSRIRLDANLDLIDSSSAIGNGSWTIQMTFNDYLQKPYTVRSIYKFSTNYVADIACTQVAQAFVPATQQFLATLYKNNNFRRTIGKNI